jgi:Protein of unknown function (DUF2752)
LPYRSLILLSGQILLALVLLVLPADFFNRGPAICLSVLLFDVECYACGLTRACMHALHFQWKEAWEFNHLVVVVLPLVAFVYAQEAWYHVKNIRKFYRSKHESTS